jgi:hypothetical protein
MWSQMHGNESTTTKALFDFLNYLNGEGKLLLDDFSFLAFRCSTLMVLRCTRARTPMASTSTEMPIKEHNQKASHCAKPSMISNPISVTTCMTSAPYGVADSGKPATVSFLAPAYNFEREVNEAVQRCM